MACNFISAAQRRLWSKVKTCVRKNDIKFTEMNQTGYTPDEYTLINCAKDICLRTRYLTVSELSDVRLISPRMCDVISTALKIARTGIYSGKRRKGGPN